MMGQRAKKGLNQCQSIFISMDMTVFFFVDWCTEKTVNLSKHPPPPQLILSTVACVCSLLCAGDRGERHHAGVSV